MKQIAGLLFSSHFAIFAILSTPTPTAATGLSHGRSSGLKIDPAQGVFLVANKEMPDPRFYQSVILITHYGADGSVGIIINHPTDVSLARALPDIDELQSLDELLYYGGPVSSNMFVMLFRSKEKPAADETDKVFGDVFISVNIKKLAHLFKTPGTDARGYAGYSGWAPGQLDYEIARGDWKIFKARVDEIFRKDISHLWRDLSFEPKPEQWIFSPTGKNPQYTHR